VRVAAPRAVCTYESTPAQHQQNHQFFDGEYPEKAMGGIRRRLHDGRDEELLGPKRPAPQPHAPSVDGAANLRPSEVARSKVGMLMEEQELLSMISFTLKESADRMTALAAEVRSETVRAELAELSRQLLDYAKVVERM
jgi:hypothetical protein